MIVSLKLETCADVPSLTDNSSYQEIPKPCSNTSIVIKIKFDDARAMIAAIGMVLQVCK